jgi:hypothetical protein
MKLWVGVAIFLFSAVSLAQERRTAPLVSRDMLEGQRLVDREDHFSIEAPKGWIWLVVPSQSADYINFSASNPDGSPGYAMNVARVDLPWSEANARGVQLGMSKTLRERGFDVQALTFARSDVPAPNSYRFSWRVILPNGTAMFRFGYELKHTKRVLSFTCFAPNDREPAAFTAFVRSLRLF